MTVVELHGQIPLGMNGKRAAGIILGILLGLSVFIWLWKGTTGPSGETGAQGKAVKALASPSIVQAPHSVKEAGQKVDSSAIEGQKEAPKRIVAHDTSVPLQRVVGETVILTRAKDWRNVGNSTLADAVHTQFWATAGGNIDYLERAIVIDGAARETLAGLMESASPTVRNEYGTIERLAAVMLAGSVGELRGFSINSQKPLSETEALLRVDTLHPNANRSYLHHELFRKGADGAWRRVITPTMAKDWVDGRAPKYNTGTPVK